MQQAIANMPVLAVLYDPKAGHWLRFSEPLEEIEVHDPDKILPALEYIEQRVEKSGLFAAGFISYEAASAFDAALQTHASGEFPLMCFSLFVKAEQINLPMPVGNIDLPDWTPEETETEFSRKVENIRAAIARGETYQVNLTFPLTSKFLQDPWLFFLHLVHGQQAGGAGYLQTERWAICSVSPELFFSRDGDQLRMRPMKGTAPRGRTLAEDLQLAADLEQSPKNRAENIMILDMVRNDLGRLAPPGILQVEEICTLEKIPFCLAADFDGYSSQQSIPGEHLSGALPLCFDHRRSQSQDHADHNRYRNQASPDLHRHLWLACTGSPGAL